MAYILCPWWFNTTKKDRPKAVQVRYEAGLDSFTAKWPVTGAYHSLTLSRGAVIPRQGSDRSAERGEQGCHNAAIRQAHIVVV